MLPATNIQKNELNIPGLLFIYKRIGRLVWSNRQQATAIYAKNVMESEGEKVKVMFCTAANKKGSVLLLWMDRISK